MNSPNHKPQLTKERPKTMKSTRPEPRDANEFRARGLRNKTVRLSYNYCGICGHTPQTNTDEPNYAPLRWWDPDDGWKIGTLCHWCHDESFTDRPKPTDYAVATNSTNGVADDVNTDEDPTLAILPALLT
jgi:hypothetical protein